MEREYTKAVIYCRVSSERQVKEGNGLDSQEYRCKEYAKSLGLEVDNVFRDEGISGGLFDRPAMKSLVRFLDNHWQNKYFVIFDDLKRFARDVEVHLRLKSELTAREAKLCCLNYNFDDSAEGEFVETIFAAQNQLERKQNRRQVCQKMKARIERGYWCFNCPPGYEYRKDKEHGKIITPIKPIADILAEGLIAFAENRLLGQVDLQKFLRAKNIDKLIGSRVDLDLVKRVVTQPLYAGLVEYPKWGITKRPGHHQAIISQETFYKIQDKLKKPERKPRETDNLEFPLRRCVNCSVCGMKMTGSVSRGKYKYYAHYTCNNKNCSANPKNISPDKMEEDYVGLLESIKVEQEVIEMAKVVATRLWEKKIKDVGADKVIKEEERKELRNMINDYIDRIPKTLSESVKALYETKIEELAKKVDELEREPENKKAPDMSEALNIVFRFLGTPAETWKNANKQGKVMIHNMIFAKNPTYSLKTGFGTPVLSPPFHIKEHISDQNNDLVELGRIALPSKKRFDNL